MKIKVRVLGRYKDLVGADEVTLDLTQGDTLRDVINAFVLTYPEAMKDKRIMIVLKDRMYVSADTMFSVGDDITLCPPVVSGG